MPESPLIQKEVAALTDLESLIAHRAKVETEVEQTFKRRRDREEQEYRVAAHALNTRFKTESEALQAEYDKVRAGIARKAKSETQSTEAEYAQAKQKLEAQFKSERNKSKKASDETRWQALAMYEAAHDNTIKRRKHDDELLTAARLDFEHLQELAQPVLDRCAKLAGPEPPPSAVVDAPEPEEPEEAVESLEDDAPGEGEEGAAPKPPVPTGRIGALQELIKKADEELLALETLKLPNFLKISNFIWPFLLLGAVVGGGLGFVIGWPIGIGVGVAAAVAAAVGGARRALEEGPARRRTPFLPAQARTGGGRSEAGRDQGMGQDRVRAAAERGRPEARGRLQEGRRQDEGPRRRGRGALAKGGRRGRRRLPPTARRDPQAVRGRVAEVRGPLSGPHRGSEREVRRRFQAASRPSSRNSGRDQDGLRRRLERADPDLDRRSGAGRRHGRRGQRRIVAPLSRLERPRHQRLDAAQGGPPGDSVRQVQLRPERVPQRLSRRPSAQGRRADPFRDARLRAVPVQSSILIKTTESGKAEANRLLQTMMIRFLTSIPPGKVRFTIIDPVGLGENFAAFMHLADYDELLVTSRIWTEARDIEQRLTDLTEHMENVIQKYLRNEFETIEEYNADAGEVAEPFRVLVVANFPANFNENAARRLVSIVASGARCGVYALISVDTKLNMPAGFQLKDLEPTAST